MPREQDSHKGSFGTVGVVGGGLHDRRRAAGGAGRAQDRRRQVLVGFAESASPLPCDPLQPELMLRDARSLLTATGT